MNRGDWVSLGAAALAVALTWLALGTQEDLAPLQPGRAQAMLTRLVHHERRERERAPAPAALAEGLDRERLRALGYVE